MVDFLFRGSLTDLDPDVSNLIQLETERQVRKLILIPSESIAPAAVRESLGSSFQNLYAEGYPDEETRKMTEIEILDYTARLTHYRRYADPRYYKGVEYADIVESLARRRCAEAFATPTTSADNLFVNVQPLSGAPANNAVYNALINPGDTIMGMNLLHGGHLTHGSSVNRSGKLYRAVQYHVDPITERINYEAVNLIAQENKPKIIIAGFSSYPWVPDWVRFREIADSVGAILMADISHIAGMVAAGIIPSPIGYAHVITFTTHKTLCGPRGACIITHDPGIARKIDRAVFPGEQGGPHVQVFAALATTFKLARSDQFRSLQSQIIKNCSVLVARLIERGLRIPFGGTNTHMANLDCRPIVGPGGTSLSGDMAARILDVAGIVLNRNTIPGDKSALNASGIRFGTPWMTQRGMKEVEMVQVADIIADILLNCKPYAVGTHPGMSLRAKIDFDILESAKLRSRNLASAAASDQKVTSHGYPHQYFVDDQPQYNFEWTTYDLKGENIREFANYVFSSDVEALQTGQSQPTSISTTTEVIEGVLTQVDPDFYRVSFPSKKSGVASAWLRDLSDGYIRFDQDISRRLPGPIYVTESHVPLPESLTGSVLDNEKPYWNGVLGGSGAGLPIFTWTELENSQIQRTPLYETHRQLGARMVPFAGWEMPVVYTSIVEEHQATRLTAGLFDVAHMGVYQIEGADACTFLDSVCGNDITILDVGELSYTHFLDAFANVIDDTLIYRRAKNRYLVVVNASNDDKDWAWLNAVRMGKVLVDRNRPWVRAFGRNAFIRNLRDLQAGGDRLVDIALQGPRSREILLALGCDAPTRRKIMDLKRTELFEGTVGGYNLIISRTGYTGEKMAFEFFIHPDRVVEFWNALMTAGAPLGLKACGLGARDSLRTEAGLPLYGHEMGGDLGLGVGEAGFGSYVKTYKPWFIGRDAYIERERMRASEVIRFRFTEKNVRMAHHGDPVLDPKGKYIGVVTSCAIDKDGYLTGQACVSLKFAEEGSSILIYQGAPKTSGKPPIELEDGDRVTLPAAALIVSRFPKANSSS